jgi:hypothetical protein
VLRLTDEEWEKIPWHSTVAASKGSTVDGTVDAPVLNDHAQAEGFDDLHVDEPELYGVDGSCNSGSDEDGDVVIMQPTSAQLKSALTIELERFTGAMAKVNTTEGVDPSILLELITQMKTARLEAEASLLQPGAADAGVGDGPERALFSHERGSKCAI